ncbi:MAG: carboxypeptidase-like regulatory domain-containing protein [Flavobacteriales bacterium]|nr:carboxypeptidase-like regulatory domain-containing protein [Flavobacteriia bacterium]NCP06393.1 carboxypeptidase-like regulatory domain-containing protein [Flavobacteriales bacterium]NCP59540.1 carboxypeptidase-like regulatory domain-containing protein [Flavobacteriales bacterium]NCP88877.1 carboxypeptidase-like regulatory domain-containing protein [Flavobacteriales bacterium]NCQ14656.1 carboxypeptidase-like regulatory domain-containing protein [Flavobacteriales bacterium]
MKLIFTYFLLFLSSVSVFSQTVTAQLIDKATQKPIPFAAIKTAEFSGVISNEEGFFTLNDIHDDTQITVLCLGYKNKTISIEDIKNQKFVVALEESLNELSTVFISNKKPNADSIIAKARQHLLDNYENKLYKHSFFSRETAYIDFDRLDFEVEKSSHVKKNQLESTNKSLDSLSKAIVNSYTIHFKDFKGTLFIDDSLKTKLIVQKATELLDQKNNLSIEEVQSRAQGVILKYLDTTLTYKLKTGLFKIEDSLSLKDEASKEKQKQEYQIKNLKGQTSNLLKRAQFYDNSMLSKLLDADLYEYSFQDISYFNDELIYIIQYKPRRSKSKYVGTIFIVDESFAVTKVDFEFADGKRGEKLNLKLLFGVKYIENMRKGTIIFQKDTLNKYQPQYIKFEEGRYFYVSRPLKFIENSTEKNKTNFEFTIEGSVITKQELLLNQSTKIALDVFDNLTEQKTVPYVKLHEYDASIWKQDQTLEPLTEMKEFKGEE